MSNIAKAQLRSRPVEYYILAEWRASPTIIGELNGKPIPECIVDERGKTLRFAGIAPRTRNGAYNISCLQDGEWIVQPGLIYAAEEQGNRKPDPAGHGSGGAGAA